MPIIKRDQLEQRLGLGRVDPRELSSTLALILHHAYHPSPTRTDFLDVDAPAISLLYDKKGNLRSIVPGKALTPKMLEEIEHKVATTLFPPPKKVVVRMPLFAALPVDGYWRYNNKLVIRRVPDHAPRPPYLWGLLTRSSWRWLSQAPRTDSCKTCAQKENRGNLP